MTPIVPTAPTEWEPIVRDRFLDTWLGLASLTVLAAAPGWGRMTWMMQCRVTVGTMTPGLETIWCTSRRRLENVLSDIEDDPRPVVVFVDDVHLARRDPLWSRIATTASGEVQFVVSAVDAPDRDMFGTDASIQVLDERDLRFTPEEIAEVMDRSGVPVVVGLRNRLVDSAKGSPVLVRQLLEHNRRRTGAGLEMTLQLPVETTLVEHVLEHVSPEVFAESAFLQFIRTASAFRRFAPQWLAYGQSEAERHHAKHMFSRLRVVPLGEIDIDPLTGVEVYVWNAATWSRFSAGESAEARIARLSRAVSFIRSHGRTGLELFYALELGDFPAAEALAWRSFRFYQRFITPETHQLLTSLPLDALSKYPYLLHLASDLRIRRQGVNALSMRGLREFLRVVPTAPGASPAHRFRTLARRVAATVSLGDRAGTIRLLDHVSEILDVEMFEASSEAAGPDAAGAEGIADDLYLVFWAASQVDDQDLALRIAMMTSIVSTNSLTVVADAQLTLLAQQDLLGIRSLAPAEEDELGSADRSQIAGLVELEVGDDRAAVAALGILDDVPLVTATRSAGDGYGLIVRSLAAPRGLDADRIDAFLGRGRRFWSDERPSTLTLFGATCGYLAIRQPGLAAALWATDPREDWFALAARGLVALNTGDPGAAVGLLAKAGQTTRAPRWSATGEVLLSAALARTGQVDAATAQLSALWDAMPAPRLVRFGLRFVSDDDVATLARGELAPRLRDVVTAARGDARPLRPALAQALTPTELEILGLLREGLNNTQIAARRFVSTNTIRTQVKAIYRKLAVGDRADAVRVGQDAGLLDKAS